MNPDDLAEIQWQKEYTYIAPNPEDWPTLDDKVKQLDLNIPDLPARAIQSIKTPTMVIVRDSDIIRPENAVEMLRLFGSVPEDTASLSQSRELDHLTGF